MEGDFTRYRRRVIGIGMVAVAAANAAFAIGRAIHGAWADIATPWWANAIGALVIAGIAIWFGRAPRNRATVAIHATAGVATATLLVPLAYGYGSSIWWLSLIAMAMLLMAAIRAAWTWVILQTMLMGGASLGLIYFGAHLPDEPALEQIASRLGFLLVLLAITLSFRKAVRHQARELRETGALLRESNQVKDRFLRHMGHELRTPLHGIIGLSEQALANPMPATQRQQVESSLGAAQVMLRLVNELLDFGDGDPAQMTLRQERMRLRRCIGSAIDACRTEAVQRGLQLSVRFDDDVADERVADEDRIRQILLKLVGNALRFTETGAISVHVRRWPEQTDGLSLVVCDSGIGIPDSARARLFEPFEQGDASATRPNGGLGLGLAAARRLARAMGGDIDLTSTVGLGTSFEVKLRLPAFVEHPAPDAPAVDPAPTRRLALLVCEDDFLCRALLEDCLRQLGHEVFAVEDGADGWKILQMRSFDIVLTDLDMPHLDGRTLVRMIREQDAARHRRATSVVAVSASVAGIPQSRSLESEGFDACLPKPFQRRDVGALIAKLATQASGDTERCAV